MEIHPVGPHPMRPQRTLPLARPPRMMLRRQLRCNTSSIILSGYSSVWPERGVWDAQAVGSNPTTLTRFLMRFAPEHYWLIEPGSEELVFTHQNYFILLRPKQKGGYVSVSLCDEFYTPIKATFTCTWGKETGIAYGAKPRKQTYFVPKKP